MARITAVVVDDDSDIAITISQLLEIKNIRVVGIGKNGNHAIRLVKDKKPDVIFLDVRMPDKDGIEALEEIKKNSLSTKVVMITAEQSNKLEESLFSKNADFILYKPIDNTKLDQILTKIEFGVAQI